jgi:hypothetical protein
MKPRILKTTKILSIAIPLTMGCSSTLTSQSPPAVEAVAEEAQPPVPSPELPDSLSLEPPPPVLDPQPLCDKDGYPLVGNLVGKNNDSPMRAFCRAQRPLAIR